MVEPPETPLQAIVVEIAVGAGPEAVPEKLNQVLMALVRADECLFRFLNPRGHTHNGASIARGRSFLEGRSGAPGRKVMEGREIASRVVSRGRNCYGSMVGRVRRGLDTALHADNIRLQQRGES